MDSAKAGPPTTSTKPGNPASRIPLRSTRHLVEDAKVRLRLLELFDLWDKKGNNVLDVSEIVWGMTIAGLKCDAASLVAAIYEISRMTGDVSDSDLKTLKNHEFVLFMLRPDMLGGRPAKAQLECIDVILKGLQQDDPVALELRKQLHRAASSVPDSSKIDGKIETASPDAPTSSEDNVFFDLGKDGNSQCKTLMSFCAQQHRFRFALFFVSWWLGGTLIYCLVDNWSFYQALYYAIQAGFSIGFGSLSEEKDRGMNAFEKCHSYNTIGNRLNHTNISALLHLFYDDTPIPQIFSSSLSSKSSSSFLCIYQYHQNENVASSMFYTIIHLTLGALLIGGILSYFSASSIEQSEKWFEDVEDDRAVSELRNYYNKTGNTIAYFWGRAKIWIGDHRTSVAAWSLLILWLIFGAIVFEAIEGGLEDAPLLKGLYTAFSAASTAGLSGPSADKPSSVVFMGLWCVVGVPLYAYSLGEIANVFTKTYVQQKGMEKRLAEVTEREYAWMNRLGDGDGQIDKFEYAMLWFLRLGLIEPDHIKQCVNDFDDLDADQNGVFSKSEMQASAFFQKFDANKDGELTVVDLKTIAKSLQKVESVEFPGKFLLDPSLNYDERKLKDDVITYDEEHKFVKVRTRKSVKERTGKRHTLRCLASLNRREFMRWWSEDFKEYTEVATEKSMLARMHVGIERLLDAIAVSQKAQEAAQEVEKADENRATHTSLNT